MITTNPIVEENLLPGSPITNWGPSTAPSDSIEGFATNLSVNIGQMIDFKINTDSSEYRIDIYRLGYYGGDGARLVDTFEHFSDTSIFQPAPLTDPSNGLIDAGNWSVTDSWAVPADATSGVYVAKLVQLDGSNGENIIPFVVRDDDSHSDIVVQTSDQTWQAYNRWGGKSLYTNDAYAVSYNRPFENFYGVHSIFGPELQAIYWLEENGFDVSYVSSIDVTSNGDLLQNHQAFLSVGHDEYWNQPQREAVTAARDAGVSLNFWSGNEVYWKTELDPSISPSGDANRTLVTYKTTYTGVNNPDGGWTGLWRDPAGGGFAENSLTGQLYLVDSDPVTPVHAIDIPYELSTLRIWRDTDVAALQPGEVYTSDGLYIGYEWDVNATSNSLADNGLSPNGLFALSQTQIQTSALQGDYLATHVTSGTATHNLTLYRAESGALVFGAGSIYFAWSLGSLDGIDGNISNPVLQQAMINLFADEGIQPGSLASHLVLASQTTDHSGPRVSFLTDTSLPVSAGQPLTITGDATDLGGGVVVGVQVSVDAGNTWRPAALENISNTTSWSYSWTSNISGSAAVLARGVDDSANLGGAYLNEHYQISEFVSNFSSSLGWNSSETLRILADVNGDGKTDIVGFGNAGVSMYGAGSGNSHLLLADFGIDQGWSSLNQRGASVISRATGASTDSAATIWGVAQDGFQFNSPTGAISIAENTQTLPEYANGTKTYANFGLDQGWSLHTTIDVAFLSNSSNYASIIGFGDAGLWIGSEAFSPSQTAQSYIADGTSALGTDAGWDNALDVRAVRDYWGDPIDLDGDGVIDFVGLGPTGIQYAFGQYVDGAYSLDSLHAGNTGVNFGRDQGWDNTTTTRAIADLNADGRVDVIGFGDAGAWVSLGQAPQADGSGAFGQAYIASTNFGADWGWSVEAHARLLGDLSGDGKISIVGFGEDDTFITFPTIDASTGVVTFDAADLLHTFASNDGFSNSENFRATGNFYGEGAQNIVVSGLSNTQIVRLNNDVV